jgi:hypothetical protein
VCGSGGKTFKCTNHMSKIWYSISLSTSLARQVDFTFTLLKQSSDAYTHASTERGSVVGEGDPDPQPGKKGEKSLGVTLRYFRCVC